MKQRTLEPSGGSPTGHQRAKRRRSLVGAVVVITGASSGSGRASALAFAAHRASVVLAARGEKALQDVASECRALGAATLVVPTDVGDPDAIDRLVGEAIDGFGRIDVWVEAASVVIAAPLGQETVEELQRLIRTNIGGAVFGSRAALTVFRRQGFGTLINVASMLALTPNPIVPAYVMSKFAIRGLSLSLRQAVVGDSDINVCVGCQGRSTRPCFSGRPTTQGASCGRFRRRMRPSELPLRSCRVHAGRDVSWSWGSRRG